MLTSFYGGGAHHSLEGWKKVELGLEEALEKLQGEGRLQEQEDYAQS